MRLDCPFINATKVEWFANYEKLSNSSRYGKIFIICPEVLKNVVERLSNRVYYLSASPIIEVGSICNNFKNTESNTENQTRYQLKKERKKERKKQNSRSWCASLVAGVLVGLRH